jgi:hypothetical protein
MMRQLGEIDEHRDTYDPNEPQEPRRYLIYLTDPQHNTFWVRNGDQRRVVDIPDQTRVFAFNNSETTHGALPPTGEKILLSVVGIIDDVRHQALLERSHSSLWRVCHQIGSRILTMSRKFSRHTVCRTP